MKNKLLFIVLIMLIGFTMIACNKIFEISGGGIGLNGDKQITMNAARRFAGEMEELMDGYIDALQSLSNEMSLYENLSPGIRRQEYENMMQSIFEDMPDFIQIFSVWKPNAIDGMDSRFAGRAGATPTGQFAFALTIVNGEIEKQTSGVVQEAMAHLTGPNSKTVEIADPAVINPGERELRIMVPIINDRTNETVGVIGCQIDIDIIQSLAEKTIRYNDEVVSIAVYTNTGFILANYAPDRIGKKLVDVEIQYGDYVDMVAEAVKNAQEYECKSYDPVLRTNMYMSITPVSLPSSQATWSVMIGSTESYIMKDVRAIIKSVIIILVIAGMAGIVVFVIIIDRRYKKKGRKI